VYTLTISRGPDKGRKLELENGRTYTIGSDPDASCQLTDPTVLPGHCSLEIMGGQVILTNHTASAGTYIGEKKVKRAQLRPNSSFRIGDSVLTITPAPRQRSERTQRDFGADPLVGKIIGGYKLNEVVGRGGMGTVYKATQLSLHRDVAVKVLSPDLAKDKGFRDLFIQEARAAAQLVDPHIVQVYDAGSEGDTTFFSMEFVGQGSVEEVLQRDGKIPWQDAILWVLEAAHGLDYAEGKGIVHRDIKPDNLMLNDDARIKIADLGLAKRGERAEDQGIIGTPHFIPPEQALGKDVDTRADIYSLGATFYRMVTGRTVFTGKSAKEIVLKHIKEPPPAASSVVSDIPDELDGLIARMLAKDPNQRYQTAKELIAAIEELCANHGIKGAIIKKGIPKRVLIPVLLLLLAAIGVAVYQVNKPEDPEKRRAREQAEKDARDARERARLAEEQRKAQERETEKLAAAKHYGDLENEMLRLPGIDETYDDKDTQDRLEGLWKDMAAKWTTFAESDNAQEFGWAEKASGQATTISTRLEKLKEVAEDKRAKFDEKFKEAEGIEKTLRQQLANLRAARKWGEALALSDLVGAKEPTKDDPFKAVEDWVYVSPLDEAVRVPATKNAKIMKVIEETRKHFRKERPLVLEQAQRDWEGVVKVADSAVKSDVLSAIQATITELDKVIEVYPDPADRVAETRDWVADARRRKKELDGRVDALREQHLIADRGAVRDFLRNARSLDPRDLRNPVMNGEIPEAIRFWTSKLDATKTERYRAFIQERIGLLKWTDSLFRQFRVAVSDTIAGTKETAPLVSLECEIPPLGDERSSHKFKFDKPSGDPYEFVVDRKYRKSETQKFGAFPMDWVHGAVFMHEGKPRWTEVTPALEFQLGAFCFETMQFADAAAHFEKVIELEQGAETRVLTKAATSLATRARREAEALATYVGLLDAVRVVATEADARQLQEKLKDFRQQYEGTLVFVEVMPTQSTLAKDFDEGTVTDIPTAPIFE